MSNSLDPDQTRHSAWPDLGHNCLQNYQQTTLRDKDGYDSSRACPCYGYVTLTLGEVSLNNVNWPLLYSLTGTWSF